MTRLATHIVLSTAHLTPEVSDLLDRMGEDVDAYVPYDDFRRHVTRCGYAVGHWVKVPSYDDADDPGRRDRELGEMPQCLADCMRHAMAFNCAWILFDRDEPSIDDIPEQEW